MGVLRERLRRWKAGECGQLWAEAVAGQEKNMSRGRRRRAVVEKEKLSQEEKNAMRCKVKAQEGQYSRAVQALVSCGLADYTTESLLEMKHKHPPPQRQPRPRADLTLHQFRGCPVPEAVLGEMVGRPSAARRSAAK